MVLTAIPVGFVAGLFGIGGGLITVPFLYFIFGSLEIDPQYVMHLAVGTSFAIIIPTSTVSVLTHHKFKAVDFDIVKNYGLFVVLGVIVGTAFAASLKTKSLVLFFSNDFIFRNLLTFNKRKGTKHNCQNEITFKSNSWFSCWVYICSYGHRRSRNECSYP